MGGLAMGGVAMGGLAMGGLAMGGVAVSFLPLCELIDYQVSIPNKTVALQVK